MPRYFIAIPIPDAAKDDLIAAQPRVVPGMRLIDRDELHLTLHFLGELAAEDEALMCKALASVPTKRFSITVRGVGQFPPEGEATVFWAGVQNNEHLMALHASIVSALAHAIGFQVELRPYSPHVTLAHLNSSVQPSLVDNYLNANRELCVSSIMVDRIALCASTAAENVPRYREVAVFELV